jgi:hypothetical protein
MLPDIVEAAVRPGETTAAEKALARLRVRARAAGTQWALGLLARSEALMAGAGAEAHYVRALELLGATPWNCSAGALTSSYGGWLRRARRHIVAGNQLRQAYEVFVAMGAEGFAARARVELLATGTRSEGNGREQ